jgi:hypothetical protein
MSESFLSGFCKIREFVVQLEGFSCILQGLRLADRRAAAAAIAAAVSFNYGWDYESVEKQDSCAKHQKCTFHGCYLLVTAS